MSATAVTTSNWVELADRAGDGLEVRLYWNDSDGRVKVTVTHLATDRVAQLDVAPGRRDGGVPPPVRLPAHLDRPAPPGRRGLSDEDRVLLAVLAALVLAASAVRGRPAAFCHVPTSAP